MSEENIPSHTHKLSGAPEGTGGTYLGYDPYSSIGQESYRFEVTTHSADTFDSGSYGKESPVAIPEHSFVYARLCNCTSDGEQTIKNLIDRVDQIDKKEGTPKSIGITGLVTGIIGTVFAVGHGLNYGIKWIAQRREEAAPLLDD